MTATAMLIVGGCAMGSHNENAKPGEVDASKWPEIEAFEDDFTRSFIQSIEETSPGYYPFLSGTGKYQMDFPGDAIIFGDKDNKITSDHTYILQKDEYEYLRFYKEAQEYDVSVIVRYYSFLGNEGIDLTLERVAKRVEKDLTFEEFPSESQSLYIAPFNYGDGNDGYLGVIQNLEEAGNIQVYYDIQCKPGIKSCEELLVDQKEEVYKWLETIEFIKESVGSEN